MRRTGRDWGVMWRCGSDLTGEKPHCSREEVMRSQRVPGLLLSERIPVHAPPPPLLSPAHNPTPA